MLVLEPYFCSFTLCNISSFFSKIARRGGERTITPKKRWKIHPSALQQGQRRLASHVLRAQSTQSAKWRQGLHTTRRLRSKQTTQGRLPPPAAGPGVTGSSRDGSSSSIPSSSSSSSSISCSSRRMFWFILRFDQNHPAAANAPATAHDADRIRKKEAGV